jgi:hypothetical protein
MGKGSKSLPYCKIYPVFKGVFPVYFPGELRVQKSDFSSARFLEWLMSRISSIIKRHRLKNTFGFKRHGYYLSEVMKNIKVPYQGKGYSLSYEVETIDLNVTTPKFLNVYSVYVKDDELKRILGEHFTILHNHIEHSNPAFEIRSADSIDEKNLKKQIAQQIINNPTE